MSSAELESGGSSTQLSATILPETIDSKAYSARTDDNEPPKKKTKFDSGPQTNITLSPQETSSDTTLSMKSQVEAKDAGTAGLIIKPKVCYESMPNGVKEMIVKYSLLGWNSRSGKVPNCVRGLRGNAEEIFYHTFVFKLHSLQRPEQMPDHVFEKIQNISLDYPFRGRPGDPNYDILPSLRCLHIHWSRRSICNTYLYTFLWMALDVHRNMEKIVLTFRNPVRTSQVPGHSRDHARRTADAAFGIEGVHEVVENEGRKETWVWQPPHGEFLRWSRYYPTVL